MPSSLHLRWSTCPDTTGHTNPSTHPSTFTLPGGGGGGDRALPRSGWLAPGHLSRPGHPAAISASDTSAPSHRCTTTIRHAPTHTHTHTYAYMNADVAPHTTPPHPHPPSSSGNSWEVGKIRSRATRPRTCSPGSSPRGWYAGAAIPARQPARLPLVSRRVYARADNRRWRAGR